MDRETIKELEKNQLGEVLARQDAKIKELEEKFEVLGNKILAYEKEILRRLGR